MPEFTTVGDPEPSWLDDEDDVLVQVFTGYDESLNDLIDARNWARKLRRERDSARGIAAALEEEIAAATEAAERLNTDVATLGEAVAGFMEGQPT